MFDEMRSLTLFAYLLKRAVEDFLIHDLYELAAFAERQVDAGRLKEVSCCEF